MESAQVELPPGRGGRAGGQGQGVGGHQAGDLSCRSRDARFSTDVDFQIKKGELVLAEQPAIVVQDGGDLAASDLSIDQHCHHFGLI